MNKSAATVLYRLFNRKGRLLYVGITSNARTRFEAHHNCFYWAQVASITAEHFANRSLAADAEAAAIRSEKPKHNTAHTGKSKAYSISEHDLAMCVHGSTVSKVARRLRIPYAVLKNKVVNAKRKPCAPDCRYCKVYPRDLTLPHPQQAAA